MVDMVKRPRVSLVKRTDKGVPIHPANARDLARNDGWAYALLRFTFAPRVRTPQV